jgi:uncharacterized OB-fold protein
MDETADQLTDEEVLAAFPTAQIDEDSIEHYRGRLQQRLMINRCRNCNAWHHPPRHFCPACWSADVGAVEVRGNGVVELSTVLHVGTPKPDIDYTIGYQLCAVRLDEAPTVRVTAPLRDLPGGAEAIGLRVRLAWSSR